MIEDEKKDSNILVYLAMIFFLALIILPPTFRSLFPDVEQGGASVENVASNLTSLSCRKTSGNYEILANSIFRKGNITKVNLTYTDTSISTTEGATIINPDGTEATTTNSGTVVDASANQTPLIDDVESEMEELRNVIGIVFNETDNIHRFVIDVTEVDAADAGLSISNRLQDLETTKEYYVSMGYACTESSS